MDAPNVTPPESAPLTGWYARAQPLLSEFKPTREHLVFSVTHSTMARSSMTLALFAPNIAIDAIGDVLCLQESDFAGLVALAKKVMQLTKSKPSGNQWRIEHTTTCWPIDYLDIFTTEASVERMSIYGFYDPKGGHLTMKDPVNGITQLPGPIVDMFLLAYEARGKYSYDDPPTGGVFQEVQAIFRKDRERLL